MRLRGWMALFLLGCGHSEPYTITGYGAIGPLVPGPEARIAGGAGGQWTENGGGIVYAGRCFSASPAVNRKRTPPDVGMIGSMEMIPAAGGSITWERCESRPQYTGSPDTSETFPALAMGGDGRLLYVEMIGDIDRQPTRPSSFPVNFHADLWLGDSAAPFTVRRKLLTLFHLDPLGHETVPPGTINYFSLATWVGPTTFLAHARNLGSNGTYTNLGLVRGTVTPDSALLAILPGTVAVERWSLAEKGTSVIFAEAGLTLRRIPLIGGSVTVAASFPAAGHRLIADVSCREDLCLVLTNEDAVYPPRISTFWVVSLSTGAVTLLRTDEKTYRSAKLSPGANVVLVGASDGMYLFSELIH